MDVCDDAQLDLAEARLISPVSSSTERDALTFYFTKYFEFLRRAGHHVIFSLPDFVKEEQRLSIDYSLIANTIEWDGKEIHGISLDK